MRLEWLAVALVKNVCFRARLLHPLLYFPPPKVGFAESAWLKAWTRPFLLQLLAEGASAELTLTFRTLAGNVAASIKWSSADPPSALPEAVLRELRSSGFECPFEPFRVSNLRLIKPAGTLLDISPEAPSMAEQVAVPSAQ